MAMSSILDVEKELQRLPEGACIEVPGGVDLDTTDALLDLHKKQHEHEELKVELEEGKIKLENLNKRTEELKEEIRRYTSPDAYTELLRKEEESYRAMERAQREREEELQKREEVERLQEEYARLKNKKAEMLHQVERDAVYGKYMERAVKMTKFEDVLQLTSHLENLLHLKEQLHQKDVESAQQVEEEKKALAALKDQQHLVRLQRNNEMYQLQTELVKARSEAVTAERRWTHIQQTAMKKTLLLGQIKMAAFSLYELTSGNQDGEEVVDMNDTEKQLEKVQKFFKDHNEFLREHQPADQRHKEKKKKKKKKKQKAN